MQNFCIKRGTLLGAATSLSLLLAACGNASEEASAPKEKAEPITHQVEIRKFLFGPETITIKAGDSVEWTNKDLAPHTATDESVAWDTSLLEKNDAKAIVFTVPGEFDYICAYHPEMRGKVIVKAD